MFREKKANAAVGYNRKGSKRGSRALTTSSKKGFAEPIPRKRARLRDSITNEVRNTPTGYRKSWQEGAN